MTKQLINPWQWQENFSYSQAVKINGTLYCSGQAAMDKDGKPVNGSMKEQVELSLKNVETVVTEAGYKLAEIVRVNVFVTSIADFFASYGSFALWLQQHHVTPSSTLVEVKSLAFPELKVEIEVTAVA